MPGRKYSQPNTSYRYGFNGKELDKEAFSTTSYDYGFRIYNPALGRFLSVDPLFRSYPWYTPYQFAGNKPITCIDLDGLEEKDKVGTVEFDLTDPNTIWVGTITTFYAGKQRDALSLSTSNPSKLAVLQQESYNSVVAKVSEIVLKNFDPNVRWDLQIGYTDRISAELASSSILEGDEVTNYNSYTDYSTPGQLIDAGKTISTELTSIANTLIIQFSRDAVFNGGRNREAIEKETDPNKKMALMAKMENDNQQAMVTFLAAAFAFAPEATNSPSFGRTTSAFEKFASPAQKLINAGNEIDRNGLTFVGRALQKHGNRVGSVFPKATGNAAKINEQGEAILTGILTNPNVQTTTRYHKSYGNLLEYRIPGGQGARFTSDGEKFIGFLEP